MQRRNTLMTKTRKVFILTVICERICETETKQDTNAGAVWLKDRSLDLFEKLFKYATNKKVIWQTSSCKWGIKIQPGVLCLPLYQQYIIVLKRYPSIYCVMQGSCFFVATFKIWTFYHTIRLTTFNWCV